MNVGSSRAGTDEEAEAEAEAAASEVAVRVSRGADAAEAAGLLRTENRTQSTA